MKIFPIFYLLITTTLFLTGCENRINYERESAFFERKNDIIYYKGNLFSGTTYTTYNNGNLSSESIIVDGKPSLIKIFDENRKIKEKTPYKDGKIDGVKEEYNNGILMRSITYSMGIRNGSFLYYQSNGKTLITKSNYYYGDEDGEREEYHSNGKIGKISNYKKGKLISSKSFDKNGNLINETKY